MSANHSTIYRGRFAPSPTGAVHYGTLVAAVGSYLQAKNNNGEWLVRMEDVDVTRKVNGADVDILNTLEAFGFEWHGDIVYQSQQTQHYQDALDQLISQSLVFSCVCSRQALAEFNSEIYPGTCRTRLLGKADKNITKEPYALRIIADDVTIEFNDTVMGRQIQNLKRECGDFIIKRRDNLFAYQLAVVVDDALQNISEIVRGADLLTVTPRQIYLQQQLNYPTPNYCHLPLAVDAKGNKISKSEGTAKVNINDKEKLLVSVLQFLSQTPPNDLADSSLNDIWTWAIKHWDISLVSKAITIKTE